MLTNSQMVSGRFERWAKYRRAVRFIREQTAAGRVVFLQNPGICAAIKITAKTAELVIARKSGLYVQRGKNAVCVWDRAVFCRITAV
jgi:hypothetical protein